MQLIRRWRVADSHFGHSIGANGRRIRNIGRFSGTRVEVMPVDDDNVQLQILRLPSCQQKAMTLYDDTPRGAHCTRRFRNGA